MSAISATAGFAWANLRVFEKLDRNVSVLTAELARHDQRRADLRIVPGEGSRYILCPGGNPAHAGFHGGYLEFRLMVENTGRRPSNVNRYDVEIVDLQNAFPNLQPQETRQGVQGRHCTYGSVGQRTLSQTGIVRVAAEHTTDNGSLLFYVPGLNLEQFVAAGLRMEGPQRRFPPLTCRLTLTDTMGCSVTGEFVLCEE